MSSGDEPSVVRELREAIQAGVLDLSGRTLMVLPPEIGQLTNLKQLILSDAELAELPPEIGQLSGLEVLNLGGTDLIVLPPEVGQLANLQVLDLSRTDVAALPRGIGQLTNLRHLNLSHTPLTLPPEIGQLANLQQIDFSMNLLEELPPEIGQLTNLRHLNLSHGSLMTLPPEIGQLTNLQHLDLSENERIDLPSEVGQLAELQTLDLRATDLVELPPGIGRLANLQELYLGRNELTDMPFEILQITGLSRLDLDNNRLTQLPPEISRLTDLQDLFLDRNELTAVPLGIVELTGLQRLDLGNNRLTELPPEIGRLTRLKQLDLGSVDQPTLPLEIKDLPSSGNRLVELPPEIGRLTSLEQLNLSDNRLAELPPEIGRLTRLKQLDLSGNQLTTLPRQLADVLDSYLVLNLRGNPLNEPFSELAERGTEALATYLRSLEAAVPLYEAKVILVGEGNVGKTSLVAALSSAPFEEDRPTTHGIKIKLLTMRHPDLAVDMTLRTWDFGGQEVYRISHQFFYGPRALYLIVWSAREGQEQNEVEGWLRRVRLRVNQDARALLVATHCAERRPEMDYPYLERVSRPLLVGGYEVDNFTGRGITKLAEGIAEQAALLPQMGQLISPRWIAARDDILARARIDPQISYRQFTDACQRHGVKDDEVATLAELMHDLGQIIYYGGDAGLRDFVVLDPEWLTKAISYVLEDEPTRESGGILDHARLTEIWQNRRDRFAYHSRYHAYFLRLMEKFDISYRLDDNEYRSLVAQLVPYNRPDLAWETSTPLPDGIRGLSLVCQLSEPVPGLVAWLTVRNHRASTGRHWRDGVFLRHPIPAYASEALIELRTPAQLAVEVRAPSPDMYFNVLRDSVEDLLTRRWPGLSYEILIPCPTRAPEGLGCRGQYPLKFLLGYRERGKTHAPCQECFEDWDISELLTGFAQPALPLQLELERLHEQVSHIGGSVKRVERGVSRLEGYAAETADSMRRVLRIVSSEIIDCPRLFTMTEETAPGARRLTRVLERRYRLVLWCEHLGYWHPWPSASYSLDRPKDWLLRIGPYVNLVSKALRLVVPIAASVMETVLTDEQLRRAQNELKLMTALVAELPDQKIEDRRELSPLESANHLTAAQGQAARALRILLFEHDHARAFGGMIRVQAPSGDIIWVCPDHYAQYDPGLPRIPSA